MMTALLAFTLAGMALLTWQRSHPPTFRTLVQYPTEATLRWVLVYRRRWERTMHTAGLIVDDKAPRLIFVSRCGAVDTLRVKLTEGTSWQDAANAYPRIEQLLGVDLIAARDGIFGTTLIECRYPPARAERRILTPAALPIRSTVNLTAVPWALHADRSPATIALKGSHVLIAGRTGAGKSSTYWSILRQLTPSIREGQVQLWGLDPKGGMEVMRCAPIWHRTAPSIPEAIDALDDLGLLMQERTRQLAGKAAAFTPTPQTPLIIVVIDELAALLAYAPPEARKRAHAALGVLLTQGRAPGVCVIGATQDVRKEVVSLRELFTHRIALATVAAEEADLILGRGASARGAATTRLLPGQAITTSATGTPSTVRVPLIGSRELDAIARFVAPNRPTVNDALGDHLDLENLPSQVPTPLALAEADRPSEDFTVMTEEEFERLRAA